MKIGLVRFVAGGAVSIAAISITLSVRALLDRPGEAALRFMSADADLVILEDIVPAPNQILAFHRIQQALAANGTKDGALNLIASEINEDQLSNSIGAYYGKSLAIEARFSGAFKPMPGSPMPEVEGVAFVALTDPAAAKVALQKHLKATNGYYRLDDGRIARIADGYLQIASRPRWFEKVDAVVNGKAPGLASRATFRAAQKLADADANIKAYIENTKTAAWGVFSVSLDDNGVRIDGRGPTNFAYEGAPPRSLKPFGAQTLKTLPSGAYGLLALASPSSLFGGMTKQLGKEQKTVDGAFRGDAVLAVYPSQKPWAGANLLIELGSNNGATPRDSLRKLLKEVTGGMNQGKPLFGKPQKIGGAELYSLSSDSAVGLKQALSAQSSKPGSDILMKDKTIAYATVGERVYIGTSVALLKRAIAASQGTGSSMAGDHDYRPLSKAVSEGTEVMLAFDMPRIIDGILNTAGKHNADTMRVVDGARVVTHGDHLLDIYGGADRQGRTNFHVFVPIDYNRAAKYIAKMND